MKKRQENDVDKFTRQLQEQIMDEVRKKYSETVIRYWQNPSNMRRIDHPDGYAKTRGSCGDTMEMYVSFSDEVITDCSFTTDGCGTTIACGSVATELAASRTFTEALGLIGAGEILKRLGGLPEEDEHCAQLAAETLRRALADYLQHKKAPWKKIYR